MIPQSLRATVAAAGQRVINPYFAGDEGQWIADSFSASVNVFASEADAVVEITADQPASIDAAPGSADWHVVTLTEGVVTINKPFTGIRLTAGAAETKFVVLVA